MSLHILELSRDELEAARVGAEWLTLSAEIEQAEGECIVEWPQLLGRYSMMTLRVIGVGRGMMRVEAICRRKRD